MKNFFLATLYLPFLINTMERLPAPSKKRPLAAQQEIETFHDAHEMEPEPALKQQRQEKRIRILKVPVPGTSITVDQPIDIKDIQDSIALASINRLIKESNKTNTDFVLARVPTSAKGKNHVEYYEANNLHQALFGNLNRPESDRPVSRYTLQTPHRAPIAGEIYYYVYFRPTKSFDYLGTDRELFSPGENPILKLTISAIFNPQKARKIWRRLDKHYQKQNMQDKATYYRERQN